MKSQRKFFFDLFISGLMHQSADGDIFSTLCCLIPHPTKIHSSISSYPILSVLLIAPRCYIFGITIKSQLSGPHLNPSQREAKKTGKNMRGYPGSREPLYSSSFLDHCSKLEKLTVFDRQRDRF